MVTLRPKFGGHLEEDVLLGLIPVRTPVISVFPQSTQTVDYDPLSKVNLPHSD